VLKGDSSLPVQKKNLKGESLVLSQKRRGVKIEHEKRRVSWFEEEREDVNKAYTRENSAWKVQPQYRPWRMGKPETLLLCREGRHQRVRGVITIIPGKGRFNGDLQGDWRKLLYYHRGRYLRRNQ